MHIRKQAGILAKILVLVALVGLVLLSWLAGHILRFSIPALWHPPLPETNPRIRYGDEIEFEGIRREVVLTGVAPETWYARIEVRAGQAPMSADCMGLTYFTSLPAKCLTADGRLVIVQEFEPNVILIPRGK
jgi:hypothetical protein